MADMVPVSNGGNRSSAVPDRYRILQRVSRGVYALNEKCESSSHIKNIERQKPSYIPLEKSTDIQSNNLMYKVNYVPEENSLEVFSTKRLPFEPKGWLLEMREQIRSKLINLKSQDTYLFAMYKSEEHDFFDVENVLFYNVGANYFRHLDVSTLEFERVYGKPPIDGFKHYQVYQLINQYREVTNHWKKDGILAKWSGIPIPTIKSDTKPYSIWYSIRRGNIEVIQRNQFSYYGLELTIHVPNTLKINVISILKPLLDGVICAFHYHDQTEWDEVIRRMSRLMSVPRGHLERMLLKKDISILGKRNVIQLFRNNIKWNPADDLFHYIKINILPSAQIKWAIDGEIFSIHIH